jgi:cysteine desulfurase/selenocysteine lyase
LSLDVSSIRKDFPILERQVNDRPLIYLDNAATSLKPQAVIDAVTGFYTRSCSNIHRAVHALSQEASELYEEAREKIARFINAEEEEVVFVRNATEAINLVARCLPRDGAVVTTLMEHHSNYLPWQVDRETRVAGVLGDGRLDIDDFRAKLGQGGVALATFTHVSNGLGVVNPVSDLTAMAREQGALVLVDGSQSVPHRPCDVKQLDCDFFVFSGHKMLGPSGIGVLYGREELLDKMSPFLWGGDMISAVHRDSYELAELPFRFEAGTPHIEGVIGLGAAVDYLSSVGMEAIHEHETRLLEVAFEGLRTIDRVTLHGPESLAQRSSAVSFALEGLEPHGLAKMLSNRYSIMLRSGYHCAQPLHEALDLLQSARASFYLYNTEDEVRQLVEAVRTLSEYYTRSGGD